MSSENPVPKLDAVILIPSALSFLTSLALALIIGADRTRQSTLSKFILALALSDLVYACLGILFAFNSFGATCPTSFTLIREYTRLISFSITIAFAVTISLLAKTGNAEASSRFKTKCFICIILLPALCVAGIFSISSSEYLDILCWKEVTPDQSFGQGLTAFFLRLPVLVTFFVTFLLYWNVIIHTKRKMEAEGYEHFSKKLYELLIYPLGIVICYIWFLANGFSSGYGFVRKMDIFSQQMQGLVNFFIFGMNYQTRTQIKDYWQRVSGRMYEFLHLQEKTTEIELQSVPLNTEYKTSNHDKF
jgi:nitrate reductase NapE component